MRRPSKHTREGRKYEPLQDKQQKYQQQVGNFFTFSINDMSLEALCANAVLGRDGRKEIWPLSFVVIFLWEKTNLNGAGDL